MWISIYLLILAGMALTLYLSNRHLNEIRDERDRTLQEISVMESFFHEIGEAFSKAQAFEEVLERILQYSIRTTKASSGAVFLFDETGEYLLAHTIQGVFPPLWKSPHINLSKVASRPKHLSDILKKQLVKLDQTILGD
ncbi:MAG: hypothetical protein P9M03_12480, partial [Candidatus Theseobacter exili]|nr:hypothetical protein [Candidatus Theseobacter exili]